MDKSTLDMNISQVRRFVELSNARKYDELLTEVLHSHYYSDFARDEDVMYRLSEDASESFSKGAEGFVERHRRFTSTFPDARMRIKDLIGHDDTVWLQTESEATFSVPIYMGGTILQPHGKQLKWGSFVKIQMKDGKILTSSVLMDNFAFLEGIGKAILVGDDQELIESYMQSLKHMGLIN